MKKICIAAISILMAGAAAAQHGGSVVVEVTSVTCKNKSWDGVVEFDGPGNEIFVSGAYHMRNASSTTYKIQKGVLRTTTYGSIAGHNERTQAGTASPTGGIDNGNTISLNNASLASVELTPDGFVLFSPTLWERDDNNEAIYERYKTQIQSDLESASLMPFPSFGSQAGNPFYGKVFSYYNAYHLAIPPIGYPSIFNPLVDPNVQGNRPMGIVKYAGQAAGFDPTIILIDAKNLWNIYNQTPINHPYPNTSYPWKTVKELSIYCGENTYGIESSNGKYYINIAIRFAPAGDDITAAWVAAHSPAASQPAVTMPVIKNIGDKTIIPIKGGPARGAAYTMSNEMMYTEWKGLMGVYGEPNKGGPFFFKINNNAFWLQDANGTSIASGGFRIENNNFIASYSYPNGDTYQIVSTGYNPANGELTGTWSGTGANAAKKGNWMAYKK